jgi:hypothetical protein
MAESEFETVFGDGVGAAEPAAARAATRSGSEGFILSLGRIWEAVLMDE